MTGVRSSANVEQLAAGSLPGTHPQGRSRAGECVNAAVKVLGHDGPVVADAAVGLLHGESWPLGRAKAHLAYVAVTRARHQLGLGGLP